MVRRTLEEPLTSSSHTCGVFNAHQEPQGEDIGLEKIGARLCEGRVNLRVTTEQTTHRVPVMRSAQ